MFKNSLAKENLAVMYLRLSKEDGEKTESNSISNQREIINSYARKNQITMIKEYVDDGYSGTNTNRPAFLRLIDDVKEGKVKTIIVKDECVIITQTPKKPVVKGFQSSYEKSYLFNTA